MFWLVVSAVIVLIGLGGLLTGLFGSTSESKGGGFGVLGLAVIVFIGWYALFSFTYVDTGKVGIVKDFGRVVAVKDSGPAWKSPWQTIVSIDITERSICADGSKPRQIQNGGLSCDSQHVVFSKEQVELSLSTALTYQIKRDPNISATAPYRPDKGAIMALYNRYKDDYESRLVLPRQTDIVKTVTDDYPGNDMAGKREEMAGLMVSRLNEEMGQYFDLRSMSILNIGFAPGVQEAKNAQFLEQQRTLAVTAAIETAKKEAERLREQAKGEADRDIELARGVSESNRLKQLNLTPELIQYESIQKLNPNVQVMVVPSGGGNIFQLPSAPAR